jgi:hypothetical protein
VTAPTAHPDPAPAGARAAAPAEVAADPGARRWRRAGDVAGVVVLLCVAVAAVVGLVPVRNGRVQDCGAPFAFALHGRLDTYPDASGAVPGADGKSVTLTKSELDDAFRNRCSQRVGSRLAPLAGVTILALVAGAVAVLGLLVDFSARWRTARDAAEAAAPPGAAPAAPSPPGEALDPDGPRSST